MEPITINTRISASVSKVWEYYTQPVHVMQWNHASPDWHCPKAMNNLIAGGTFTYTMAAKDGSYGFDFGGRYEKVENEKAIYYTLDDKRKVFTDFSEENGSTYVTIRFDPEQENSRELQQAGWQAILDNFKKHVEE